jgi:hypothetical protein
MQEGRKEGGREGGRENVYNKTTKDSERQR